MERIAKAILSINSNAKITECLEFLDPLVLLVHARTILNLLYGITINSRLSPILQKHSGNAWG